MIYVISLITALYCSCFPVSVSEISQEQQTPEYNYYSSQLCAGDFLSFGNKAIQFKKVVSDSRCPQGTTCIWAGNVKLLVEFFENGKSVGEKVIVSQAPELPENLNFDLSISGVTVSPYPSVKYKIQPEEYSVNMTVKEKVEAR